MDNSQASAPQLDETEIERQGLPPQRHAGQVGYGPNYNSDPTIQEKITGLKEELKGKVKHDPELVRHGREIRTGEEKRKKTTGEDKPNLFQSAKDSDKSPGSSSTSRDTSTPNKDGPVHENNGKTPKVKAATVASESPKDADIQKCGESIEGGKSK